MAVDVLSEIEIQAPRAAVAAYAADPDNAPAWTVNIKSVEWETTPPLALGSRIAFVAQFLGRRLAYSYEVVAYEPGAHLVMRSSSGPFPMETSYAWADAGEGGTRMSLRNRGEPAGFSRLLSPFMVPAMRRAAAEDLRRLKEILERRGW